MSYFKVKPNRDRAWQPQQNIPEVQKTPEWACDNLRWIGSFYDIPVRSNYLLSGTADRPGNNGDQSFMTSYQNSPVRHMLRMMQYFLGTQDNVNYAHLTQNVETTNALPNWIRGHRIHNLVSFMKDAATKLLQNCEFSVKSMSELAVSDRKKFLDLLMVQFEMAGFFSRVEQDYGLKIDFANGQTFQFEEEVSDFMQNGGYKDMDEEIQTLLATNWWYQNNGLSKALQSFMHTNIAGVTGIEHCVYNGKQIADLIPPHQLIVDRRVDDDYNRYARFVGRINPLTPEEIFERWPNSDEKQKEEIRNMARNSALSEEYCVSKNIQWWPMGNGQTSGLVNCVTGYWLTYRNIPKTRYKNDYGIQKMRKSKANEYGDDTILDIYKGTIIGNAFISDFGYCKNVAEDFYNKSRPLLPIQVFMPNMLLGESRSIVSRLHELQDERDLYKFKIKDMVGKSKGRVVLIRGDKLGNATQVKELYDDLTSLGMTVVTTDGEDAADDGKPVVEQIDMTMDPNIKALFEIIAQIDREMEEIANISKISLGQQQTYIGLGTQENVMANASGSTYVYSGFMDFIQRNAQYAVDVAKNLITEDESDYYQMLIGKRGVEYLKMSKKIRYNNPLVQIRINDIIEDKSKERLLAIAQAMAQNQQIDMLDFIHIETSKTYQEVVRKLEYSLKKKKDEAEKAQAMQAMIDQVNQQNQALAAQGNAQVAAGGKVATTAMANEAAAQQPQM